MKREDISNAVSNISTQYIQEAAEYAPSPKKGKLFKKSFGKAIIAAVLILCFVVMGIGVFSSGNMAVSAYACGTDEEITAAGVTIHTGTIKDSGKMQGHPLMFYLSGKEIESVRFSCKNYEINFMDWTEKRDEYGYAQNFTVAYGEDESEYYYLTIDWFPEAIVRELTDHKESTIAGLPAERKEDIIVMEITFINGKTAIKAITVSLQDDGTFYAAFGDYQIKKTDTFVSRSDSTAIPREILYAQEGSLKDFEKGETQKEIPSDCIGFDAQGSANDDSLNFNAQGNTNGDNLGFNAQGGTNGDDLGSGTQEGTKQDETQPVPNTSYTLLAAEEIAKVYYENTVFELVSLELQSQSADEIIYSVCVKKGGILQEPNRSIMLRLTDGVWEVVNEGY